MGPGFRRGRSIPHLEREEELFSDSERARKSHMSGELESLKAPNPTSIAFQLIRFFFFTVTLFSMGSHSPGKLNLSLSPPSTYKQHLPTSCEKQKCFTL